MHNIVLADGTQTLPSKPILAETQDVKNMIAWAKGRYTKVVDLGAGEGGYSVAFARAGFDVIAVEARKENCEKIAYASGGQVRTIEATVEEYLSISPGTRPKETLVLCLGLLYHLPKPAIVLNDIAKMYSGLILSTHYALDYHWQYDRVPGFGSWTLKRIYKRLPFLFKHIHFGLSKLTTHEGRKGRWYPEYSPKEKNVSNLAHSSYHNPNSFWLTLDEIFSICRENYLFRDVVRVNKSHQGILAYFER